MDATILLDIISATIRIATPLLFAALGGLISERAGTFAVGIEGMMLIGAFGGAVTAHFTGSILFGFGIAMLCGALLGLIYSVAVTRFRADQMVTGLAINILAIGLTSFLLRGLFDGKAPVIRLPIIPPWPVPGLSGIPVLGPLLFNHPPITYLGFLLVIPLTFFMFRTRPGLVLRVVGENQDAAYAAGFHPTIVRVAANLACGALAALGGAVLALQEVGTFTDNMTNGRGFIALAAIIVGSWHPLGVMLGCLLFGLVAAIELRVQGWGIPVSSYLVQMLPYLMALALLSGLGRSARMPGGIGLPFQKN